MVNSIVLSALSWASSLKNSVATRLREEVGQDLIEYAVLVGFIAAAGAAAFFFADLGPKLQEFADRVGACVSLNSDGCSGN